MNVNKKNSKILISIYLALPLLILIFILINPFAENKADNKLLNFYSDNPKVISFKGFYFISQTTDNYRLMYYDFLEDSIFQIFNDKNQNVIEVEQNFLNNSIFFITVNRLNKKTAIPEYEGIKLYWHDKGNKKPNLINQFSPSIQIYSFWMDINRYKIVRVYFDEIVASYVVKNSLVYNPFGKLLSEENEVFDLVKSGYPVKEKVAPKFYSPDRKFQIKIVEDSVLIQKENVEKTKKLLQNKNIIDLVWADNQKHLIIFYEDIKSKTKNILLFDLKNNRIVKTFDEKGIKNFLVIGNYLIFDFIENNSQLIEVFNIEKLLSVKKISLGKNSYLKNVVLR